MKTKHAHDREVEYAVRYLAPGELEETLDPVGSPDVAEEHIGDLAARLGVDAVLVTRTVTPWQVAR